MTQRFILDENVVILAQRGESDTGQRDLTCLSLITRIIRICHSMVADRNLRQKYFRQLSRQPPMGLQQGPLVLRILADAAQIPGKFDLGPNAPPFPEEVDIPIGSQDDVEIVRLAVETGAVLVTTDQPLREHLNSSGIAEAYNLQVLSPREALEQL